MTSSDLPFEVGPPIGADPEESGYDAGGWLRSGSAYMVVPETPRPDPLGDLARAAEAFRHRDPPPPMPTVLPASWVDALREERPEETADLIDRGVITTPAEFLSGQGTLLIPDDMTPAHDYTSTACQHGLHARCRRACKFCDMPCRCDCHTEETPR